MGNNKNRREQGRKNRRDDYKAFQIERGQKSFEALLAEFEQEVEVDA